jgi:hypothetical protein
MRNMVTKLQNELFEGHNGNGSGGEKQFGWK